MTQIGPYLIIRKDAYPAFEKAHKLARCLSQNDIEEILSGKKHLHLNPKRSPRRAIQGVINEIPSNCN